MRLKAYKNEQVASALVEVFDRIYTYPLLRWRAFLRSLLFTTVVSAIFLFEMGGSITRLFLFGETYSFLNLLFLLVGLLFNAFTDYLSLFVIRPLLFRSGTKPVIGLVLGTVSGAAIVIGGHLLRAVVVNIMEFSDLFWLSTFLVLQGALAFGVMYLIYQRFLMVPALAVFLWLPLLALGILTVRLLTPLSWIVGRTQWFLKEGKEHPLKAIGYVAAVVVFLGTVAGRVVFGA
jgi:hypothetical protein